VVYLGAITSRFEASRKGCVICLLAVDDLAVLNETSSASWTVPGMYNTKKSGCNACALDSIFLWFNQTCSQ
jgi:hypothetical protein